ncbi:MAG: hypothetical protein OXC03_01075 [Flavobacteriaceae bacterium]|nr:hypothetical protein [Flavobacteriaceae bacterium]
MSINKYFKKHFETQCFQLIKEAYDFAIQDKVIKLDWYENDVTTALNDYIEDSLKRKKFHIISTVDPPIRKDDIKKRKRLC